MDHHPHLQMSPWEAAATGHTDVLSAMLVHDEQDLCSIRDYQGKTLLMCAIEAQQEGSAAVLINTRRSLDQADHFGYRAAHWACLVGQVRTLQRLLEAGAAARCRTRGARWTPMMVAAARGHHECIRALLRHHSGDEAWAAAADVDAEGSTALHCACMNGRTEAALVLMAKGLADPNAKDLKGRTPITLAYDRRHTLCAQIIEDYQRVQLLKTWRIFYTKRSSVWGAHRYPPLMPTGHNGPFHFVREVLHHSVLHLNDDIFRELKEYLSFSEPE